MTKISQYSTDVNITGNDKWIGSDAQNFLITKNFTPNNLASYFNENNVIDIGTSIRYRYQTLLPGETREQGTISFETEIGPQVNFSDITTFLIAKNTLKGNTVTNYLDFLVDGKVLLSKASNINTFGYYKITSIEPYIPDTNFFVVVVEFIEGNGFIYEDLDYLVSLVDKVEGSGGGAVWGAITGDIEDQTDLINYISSQITTPNLQVVTGEGNTTTIEIEVTDIAGEQYNTVSNTQMLIVDDPNSLHHSFNINGISRLSPTGTTTIQYENPTGTGLIYVPNVVDSIETFALLSDITTLDLQEVLTNGATALDLPITLNNTAGEQIMLDPSYSYFNDSFGNSFIITGGALILNNTGGADLAINADLINFQQGGDNGGYSMTEITRGVNSYLLPLGESSPLATLPIIKTANFTAEINQRYHTNGTITVTDPTPVTNKGYIVFVVSGTTTVNGIGYTANQLVYRFYNGTVWTSTLINGGAGYVPYTGATANVDLGVYGLTSEFLQINTTPTTYTPGVGKLGWNDTDGTLEFQLKGGNVTLQIGQEQVIRVVNKTSPSINLLEADYQVCLISGAQGQRVSVRLAQANNDANSAGTIGIVTETINANQEGFITTSGQVKKINTTGSLQGETWTDGDVLYLSAVTAGAITNVKPAAPAHTVIVGYVEYVHAINGKIFVKIDNGYELDELHNVSITTPLDNQALVYETATTLWKNKTLVEDSITNGVTDKSPSQNAVFDALALKADKSTSAYSIKVNNTNATANETETTYIANGQQVYSGTITWTGTTAPSGATTHTYNWVQVGNLVTLTITLAYAVAGSTLTSVLVTLPSDCPDPIKPTGLTGASNNLYFGTGALTQAATTTPSNLARVILRANAGNNGFQILCTGGSGNHTFSSITIQYYTS